jgi:predicted dehydrogenase
MTTEPMNFAVIGCGQLARGQHIPNLAASTRAVLHTCCDVDEQALALCRDEYGARKTCGDFEQVFADPEIEAVVVATTEKLRLPILRAACEAGKAVYCEKPVAATLEQLGEIHRLVRESNIPFCVGHNRRSSPAMLDANRIFRGHMDAPQPQPWRFDREGPARPALAEDAAVGMHIRINDDWYSWKAWALDKTHAPHGAMLFEMTHFTDICNWMIDAEPLEATAYRSGELNCGVILGYDDGSVATIGMYGNGTFGYMKELYEMFGRGGAVIVDHMLEVRTAGIESAPARTTYPMLKDRHGGVGGELGVPGWLAKKRLACCEAAEARDPLLAFTAEPDKGHARQIERFIDEIRGDGPRVCGIDEAVRATRAAFAAVHSAESGRTFRLDELPA